MSIDDVSMTSGNPTAATSTSTPCNGGEPAFHESWTTQQMGNLTTGRQRELPGKSDSMSTLNTYYLDAMIPTTHQSSHNHKSSMIHESKSNGSAGNNNAYPPGRASSPPELMSHTEPEHFSNSMDQHPAHLRPSMFTNGQAPSTGVSQMSMLSDLSDLSFCKRGGGESMRSMAMKAQMALKSDTTMSDMSEAMGALELMKRNM